MDKKPDGMPDPPENPSATSFLRVRRDHLKREIEDLETRKTVEEWLEGQFKKLAEILPECIFFKDREGCFIWVNRATVNFFGKADLSEIVGKTDYDFFPEQHADEARADELRVLETGEPIFDRLENDNYADGSPRWAHVTRLPLRNAAGEIVGTYGNTKDVTDLKKTQGALEQESTLLQALMEHIPDAVYFKDAHSRFLRVGKGIHLEGLKRTEDAIGKTDFDYFTREHAQQAYDDEQEIIRTGVPIVDKIEKETFPDKPDGWVSTTKVPMHDKAGRVTGIVGISRDVTERFKAEEAVRKAKDELEIRVQERTRALVQEIKEHLNTEKALRDGERKLQESNQRLVTRVEQLNFLNASAQRMSRSAWRRDLLPAIVEAFAQSRPGLEVALLEKEGDAHVLLAGTPGLHDKGWDARCVPLCDRLAKDEDAPILIPDLRRDLNLAALNLAPGEEISFLQIPLRVEEHTLAWVQVFGDLGFAMWYSQETLMINTLAAQAALSLSNSNSFRSLAAKARVEGELAVAQNIQKRFTPVHSPDIPRVALKGVYFPAFEVGGDYLDYFRTERGDWVIVVADVSGKGIPAALVMTMLRSTIHAEARYEHTAKRLLCSVNDIMVKDLDDRSFITAACLVINPQGTSMTYARAGHPPLLIRRGSSVSQPKALSPRGLALGIVEGEVFSSVLEEVTVPLQAGDSFLLFTDGLTEAMDPERRMYGMPRLQSLLTRENSEAPDAVVQRILDDVRDFTRNQPSHDDLTMLALEVKG